MKLSEIYHQRQEQGGSGVASINTGGKKLSEVYHAMKRAEAIEQERQRQKAEVQTNVLKPGPYSNEFLIKQSLKTQGTNSPLVKQIQDYTGMDKASAGIYAMTMGDKSSMGKAAGKVLEDVARKAHPDSQFAQYKNYEDYSNTVRQTLGKTDPSDYNSAIIKLEKEIKVLEDKKKTYDNSKKSHIGFDSAYRKNPAYGIDIDDVVKKIGYLKTALRQYKDKKDLKPYEDEALKVNDWRTTTYIPAAETTNDNLNNVKLFLDWAHGYKKGEYKNPNGAKTTYNLDNSYHEDFGGWENATEEQIKTLTYWYNTDRSKANKYFESVSKKWLEERSYKLAEQASEKYNNASGAKKFWYGVKDFFGIEKLPSSVLAFTSEIVQLVADGEVSPYTPAFDALTKGNAINAEIMSDMNPFLKFVYSAGSSTAQNVIGVATIGEVGYLASMGLQAQTTSYKQYIDSGADPDAALITSGIIGAVEVLSEKVGLETWLKGFDTKTAETFIKSWIKSMGYEASEEVFSSIAGKFAESVVMGSDAPDEVEIQRLMTEEGLTYERAKEKVTLENIKDTVYEAVVAAVSAGLSGGTVTLNSTVSNKLSERRFNNAIGQRIFENNNVDSLVNEAQNTLKNAEQNPDGIELSETTKKDIKNLKESIEALKDSNNKKYTRNIGQLFANHLDLVSSLSHDSKVSTIKPAVMNAMQNIGIDAALTDEALDIIWRKVSFGTSEVYTEEQDILDEIGGEQLLNELISDNELAAKVTAQNFLDGAISGQFNNFIQGRVDRTEQNTEQSSEANLPNTSESIKENTASPLTLTEPDGREIVDMPTYKEATEDAVRKMNGLTVKTGTQKHIEKLAGALKSVSNVVWDESVPVGEGRYNPETKTITLNPNSSVTQNYAYLFKHEFSHSLEGKAKFNQFVTWLFDKSKSFDAFVNMIAERNGIEFTEDMSPEQKKKAVIDHYVEEYSSEYGNLSPETQREYAKIEMVADYVGGFLFTGESYEVNAKNLAIGDFSQDTEASLNAIEEIANEDKSFIRMIIDFIKDLRNKINLALGKNGKTLAEDLKRAEQYLETVYKSAEVKGEGKSDVKYSFGGPHAETSDTSLFEKAQTLEKDGTDSETIRKETGWFKGYDGKWRFEIDDSNAQFDKNAFGEFSKDKLEYIQLLANDEFNARARQLYDNGANAIVHLGDIYHNEELYNAYPDLKNIRVNFEKMSNSTQGAYDSDYESITLNYSLDNNTLKSVVAHEIQHAIQDIEGFTSGTDLIDAGSVEKYQKTAGEIEARDVENRMDMTAEQRKNTRPDIDRADVVFAKENRFSYSIEKDSNGDYVVVVNTDQGIFVGVEPRDYSKVAREYFNEHFKGVALPLGNSGDMVGFSKKMPGEYTYPHTTLDNQSVEYSAKMKAITELDNLLRTAKEHTYSKDTKGNKEATLGWDYYKVTFICDGREISGLINIANSEKGRVFYDMTKIKVASAISEKYVTLLAHSQFTSRNATKTSIRQNTANSQEKFSKGVPVDSQGNELSENQQKYFENSAVRDDNGNLLVVYHGTRKADFTVFKYNLNYFTDNKIMADSYAPSSEMYTGYLNIEKPFVVDAHGDKWSGITIDEEFKDLLQEYGSSVFKSDGKWKTSVADIVSAVEDIEMYDGVIIKNVDDTGSYYKKSDKNIGNDYIIFNSNQFKNIDNLNPTDTPDIRYSKGIPVPTLRYNTEEFAKSLIRKAHSTIEADTVTERLKEIVKAYNKFDTERANSLISKLTLDIAEYQKPVREYWAQEYLDNLKGETVRVFKEDMGDIDFAGDTLKGLKESTGIKFVISESEAREWLAESKGEKITSKTAFKNLCRKYGLVIDNDGNYSGLDNLSEIGVNVDEDNLEMSPIEQLKNRYEQMTNAYEPFDEAGLAEYLAKDIYDQLENTGARAENKRLTQARREGVTKGEGYLNDYKEKQKRQRDAATKAARMRDLQKKTDRLLKSFERRLVKPTRASHIPSDLVRACIDALEIIQQNPVLQDEMAIGSKYAPELEMLNQKIQNETDPEKREKLVTKYNKLMGIATNVADKVSVLTAKYASYKNNSKYNTIYSEGVLDALVNLQVTIEETEPHNYSEEQLRCVHNTFAMLDTLIRNEDKFVASKIKEAVSSAGIKWIGEIERSQGKLMKGVDTFITAMTSPMRYFRRLGNYEAGSISEQLGEMLNEGSHNAMRYKMEAQDVFRHLFAGEHNIKEARALQSTKAEDLVDSGLTTRSGKHIMITKAMRISLFMHSLNEQNMRHLMSGVFVPGVTKYYKKGMSAALDEKVRGFIENPETWQMDIARELSDYEIEWIKALQDYYGSYSAPRLNDVSFQLYGFEKAVVQNYFPIRTADEFTNKPIEGIKHDFSIEAAGFMKNRVDASNPMILTDAIDQVNGDIDSHANYYGYAVPMNNFNKVYNYTSGSYGASVKEAISEKYGNGKKNNAFLAKGNNYIERILTDITGQTAKESSIFDVLRGNYAQAVLAFNIPVALKQAASYPTAAATLGWEPLLKALVVVEKNGGSKSFVFSKAEMEIIKKYSPLLWYRSQGGTDTELHDIEAKKRAGDKLVTNAPALFNWIQKVDMATVGRLWYAAKYYVDDNFKSLTKDSDNYYKKVAEIFNKTVEETQPNYNTLQRPQILRSTNPITQAMSMFYTQRLQNVNIIVDAALNLKAQIQNEKTGISDSYEVKLAAKRLRRAISSQIVAANVLSVMQLLASALLNNMGGYRDDDDELTAQSILSGYFDTVLETLIGSALFGTQVYAIGKAITGTGKWYDMSVPAVDSINSLISSGINVARGAGDVITLVNNGASLSDIILSQSRNLNDSVDAVSKFLGIPVENIRKVGLGIYNDVADIIQGEAFANAIKDNTVNRFFGKAIQKKSQKYNVIYSALMDGDTAKAETKYQELISSGTKESSINQGILKVFKEDSTVAKQTNAATEKLKNNSSYNRLDSESKTAVQQGIKNYFAKKAMSEVFDHTSDNYQEEVKKADRVINKGVSIDIYLVAKEMFKKKYADSDNSGGVSKAEKYAAIDNLDTSEKVKSVLYDELIK